METDDQSSSMRAGAQTRGAFDRECFARQLASVLRSGLAEAIIDVT